MTLAEEKLKQLREGNRGNYWNGDDMDALLDYAAVLREGLEKYKQMWIGHPSNAYSAEAPAKADRILLGE